MCSLQTTACSNKIPFRTQTCLIGWRSLNLFLAIQRFLERNKCLIKNIYIYIKPVEIPQCENEKLICVLQPGILTTQHMTCARRKSLHVVLGFSPEVPSSPCSPFSPLSPLPRSGPAHDYCTLCRAPCLNHSILWRFWRKLRRLRLYGLKESMQKAHDTSPPNVTQLYDAIYIYINMCA